MDHRIIIFTGKGGVGKSSVAAAHALKSASQGKSTLLVSTDMAHNLGDIFEVSLGREIKNISQDLDLYEIDPQTVMEEDFADIMKYLTGLVSQKDVFGLEDLGMLPGMEELFSLLKIAQLHNSRVYDRIIVDCAPTGETLSLLKFPELLSWYMEKLFPIGKVGVRILSPVSKQIFQIEMPDRHAMNDIEKMFLKLMELEELLKNREITSIRIVTTPEKMVVEETKRNYMYMNLYDFNVDGLYINRILPRDINNHFFDEWLTIQQKYITELKETFAALPIRQIPWYEEELRGTENIERIVRDVLTGEDVFETGVIREREHFEQTEEGYLLKVRIPGADKNDIDLYQGATDVVIRTGNVKRNIPLPNILRDYAVSGAKFEDGVLNIRFGKGGDQDDE
ncbi:MAG: ArsA family ATPase [Lachnospiraceae bacterium]|nr:ArsA family ATPase [Lachnospiraceae bacterium]